MLLLFPLVVWFLATLTPSERTMRARMAAHTLHAKHDPKETSAAGRAAFLASFETQVDPEGVLPPDERARRAEQLFKAHMTRLSFKAAQARRATKKAS